MKTASREIYIPREWWWQSTKLISCKVRLLFDLQHKFILIRMFKVVVIEAAYRYGEEVRTQC